MRNGAEKGDSMKRFGRFIINSLLLLSSVLCLTVVASWIRSYRRADFLFVHTKTPSFVAIIGIRAGYIIVETRNGGFRDLFSKVGYYSYQSHRAWKMAKIEDAYLGIYWKKETDSSRLPVWEALLIPIAYLVAFFSALPVVWVFKTLKQRRAILQGHCPTCGYDLRATPDRCPECGTVPEKVKA
jgi:hypothetical protein